MRFAAYHLSLAFIAALQPSLALLRAKSRDEADQLDRASRSVARNIAEGSGRFGRDRVQFRRIAYGSLLESRASIDIAVACGWMAPPSEALAIADELGRVLWSLCR